MLSVPGLAVALCAASQLLTLVKAQDTIYASFVLTRTGERTPLVSHWSDIVQLTALGANGIFNVGSDLRKRYIGANGTSSTVLQGLAANVVDPNQLTILSSDRQYTTASAQALLQAFYPPTTINDTSNQQLGLMSNGSVIFNPLNGYQYAWIHTASNTDPESIFVSSTAQCTLWQANADSWSLSSGFKSTQQMFQDFYTRAGDVLADDVLGKQYYDFENAYYIADYLSFMDKHNSTYHDYLTDGTRLNDSHFPQMLDLANQAEWATYGTGFSEGNQTIALVAGQSLASVISDALTSNIITQGNSNKLTLLFTEFPPFLSFSALAELPANGQSDSLDFTAIPDFGSQLIVELFTDGTSGSNDSTANYPDSTDLRVRLLFRNGTDTSAPLTAYNMFGLSEAVMAWQDFKSRLDQVSLQGTTASDPSDDALSVWCSNCESWNNTQFCVATNIDAVEVASGYSDSTGTPHGRSEMTNALAGAIGAVATLCLLGLIIFLGVGCLGWRVTRKPNGNPTPAPATSPKRTTSGGFKGGMKLESDVDLPNGGVANAESGHGRVSSWEMKNGPVVSPVSPSDTQQAWQSRRRDDDELSERVNPFADPVMPRDHV